MNNMELIQAMQNPQKYIQQALMNNPTLKDNPMVQDAMNNPKNAEQIARNLAKSYGIDLSMFGIK